jgi:hypothetical protein
MDALGSPPATREVPIVARTKRNSGFKTKER